MRVASNSSIVPYHSASLGHTDAHIGLSPSEVRSVHMSHFIIWSNSATYFGHAERAGEHAVGAADAARLERRLHDAVLGLLDRVGRAHLAQVGSSQCMHTIGAVCVLVGAVDALEVDQRLAAVGAALRARLHARLAADAAALVDDEHRAVVDAEASRLTAPSVQFEVAGVGGRGVPAGALDAHGGDLELGHLRQRVDGPVGQLVGGLARRASGTG